jgi:hypothetical protein
MHLATSVEFWNVEHLAIARPGVVHVDPQVPRIRIVDDDLGKIQRRLFLTLGRIRALGCRKLETVAGLHFRRCHWGNGRQPTRLSRHRGTLSGESREIFRLGSLCFLSLSGGRVRPRRIGEDGDGRSRLSSAHGQQTCGSLRWRQRPTGRAATSHCSEKFSSAQSASVEVD